MFETLDKYNAAEILKNRILFLGRRRKLYPDFAFLVDAIKSGDLIKQTLPQMNVPSNNDASDDLPSYEDALDMGLKVKDD